MAIIVYLFIKDDGPPQVNVDNHFAHFESDSKLGVYQNAALSTDALECAAIGRQILASNGSAIDSAIATLLCMGIVIPESMGLGGGCFITYYDASTRKATVIDGREVAPSYATEDMFAGNFSAASLGPISMGIPGELAAYWQAHQRFGRLPWAQLFPPSIQLAENGFLVGHHLASAIEQKESLLIGRPIEKVFTHSNGSFLKEGDRMKRPDLAATYRILANSTDREFYEGDIGRRLLNDLASQGGQITASDLANYKANVDEPLTMSLPNGMTFFGVNAPGSGPLLGFMLRTMLQIYNSTQLDANSDLEEATLFYHRLVEVWKHAYAYRQKLGDAKFDDVTAVVNRLTSQKFADYVQGAINDSATFEPNFYGHDASYLKSDEGTAHMSVVDRDGNAVSVGTSVNAYFGSKIYSPSTGLILNDVMDDFSNPGVENQFFLPPSLMNRAAPGKRPLSSMSPTILVDSSGQVRLAVGGSGGTHITSASSFIALHNIVLRQNIKEAIDAPRIHHQLYPNKISYEDNFPVEILDGLQARGHDIEPIIGRGSIIMAVAREANGNLDANSDFRKGGAVQGI